MGMQILDHYRLGLLVQNAVHNNPSPKTSSSYRQCILEVIIEVIGCVYIYIRVVVQTESIAIEAKNNTVFCSTEFFCPLSQSIAGIMFAFWWGHASEIVHDRADTLRLD